MKKFIKNCIKYLFIFALMFTLFSCKDNCKKEQHTHEYVDGVCSCGEKKEQKFIVTFKNVITSKRYYICIMNFF